MYTIESVHIADFHNLYKKCEKVNKHLSRLNNQYKRLGNIQDKLFKNIFIFRIIFCHEQASRINNLMVKNRNKFIEYNDILLKAANKMMLINSIISQYYDKEIEETIKGYGIGAKDPIGVLMTTGIEYSFDDFDEGQI